MTRSAFRPVWVILITAAVYIALFTSLLVTHLKVPDAPSSAAPAAGINLTEASHDLKVLTSHFHPYNSDANDVVRNWLLHRIEQILKNNNASFDRELLGHTELKLQREGLSRTPGVTVYNDLNSNITFSSGNLPVYFEGTNIIVRIRGSETTEKHGGVLVNAHYDSVSTGYGATDDGVGVITLLQLLSHFSVPEKKPPKRDLILLFNNGEEDFLNGAKAFLRHPVSKIPRTFLNLEGAGAGGRAILFRSTDTEVTRSYKNSPYPYGSIITGDGFKRGMIRSQTDYIVFNGDLGLRGLDVAFFEPRARYHTQEDDARDTSIKSIWHMLSASIATTEALTSDTSSEFDGPVRNNNRVDSGHGSNAVWFDIFGRTFGVLKLHTLFALSVTFLVVTPILLIVLSVILSKVDKWYLFSRKHYIHSTDDDAPIQLKGWHGFFCDPIAFIVATAAVVGLSYLFVKINPFIVYSSEYSVWASFLTAFFCLNWFLLRGADAMRPSALQRIYSLMWTYIGAYILLVIATVAENNFSLGGVYFIVIYFAASFVALLLAYLELFALPKKSALPDPSAESEEDSETVSSRPQTGTTANNDDSANERTSLLSGNRQRTTFARHGGSRRHSADDGTSTAVGEPLAEHAAYGGEQEWSECLPTWLWIPEFLVLAPIPIILVGQLGLLLTAALRQTLADGSPPLPVYLFIAFFGILLLIPLSPFIHRYTYHIPLFLFLIFFGTLIYNLTAFPFSPNNRLKIYFYQSVDLDSGLSTVKLILPEPFHHPILASLPSTFENPAKCGPSTVGNRKELYECNYTGPAPNLYEPLPIGIPPEKAYNKLVTFTVERVNATNSTDPRLPKNVADFTIDAYHTRSCRLYFAAPVSYLHVAGSSSSNPQDPPLLGKEGAKEFRIWRRDWKKEWNVRVGWDGKKGTGLSGRVTCLWADVNALGTVPAFDEVVQYVPTWVVVSKMMDGIVEGGKAFNV
ncbi:hypothetical protein M501DRAFT_1001161 [Patellaria atrata CBS 101060]|uniref:Peptide hydrolase n=1 Tax=Patellaria atrata CBS 101060 TaxID=1346257 RepID=A0A9P4VNI3_9PEZI|nr:hypothetical protein M501DRAFT_1001161 [Patellaria atrata CBS 101060]